MARLTKRKAVELHRQLWDWLYHHPSKSKSEWPGWEENGGSVEPAEMDCFCCEYAKRHGPPSTFSCRLCPLEWDRGTGLCLGGLYHKYVRGGRKRYAKLIRDLAERR
jgi:hypothetical protein